jgi:sulfur carrier protein
MMNQHASSSPPSAGIAITVNGQHQPLEAGCTIAGLLVLRGLHQRRVAVMVNGDIVPRAMHDQHILSDGDSVELISLAGGG